MCIGKIFKFLNFRGQRTEDSSLRSVSLKDGSANEPCDPPKPMDWSRLPDELKYLCGPVEKFFPYYQDEMTMADARNEMPAEDWEELKAVGQKIRENRHFPLIDQGSLRKIWKEPPQICISSRDCLTCRIFCFNKESRFFTKDLPHASASRS